MLLLALLLCALQPQAASQPQPPSGLLLGRVLDGDSAQPVPGAVVTLTVIGISPRKVIADGEGRFLFTNVADGELTVTATKSGFLPGRLGQRSPRGPARTMMIVNGARIGDAVVRLWRPAAIGGSVYNDAGEPAVGIEVRLHERVVSDDGERIVSGSAAAVTTTDDRGVYRFASVSPGDYVVLARSPSDMGLRIVMSLAMSEQSAIAAVAARASTAANLENLVDIDPSVRIYAPTFSGGTTSPVEAQGVRVRAGDERRGVDLRVRAVPVSTVAGNLIGPDGEPVGMTRVRLMLGASEIEIAEGTSNADGRFAIAGVPAGPYLLRVARGGQGPTPGRGRGGAPAENDDSALSAARPIVAGDSEAASLSIAMRRGPRIRGRIEFANQDERPAPDQLGQFILNAADASTSSPLDGGFARVQPDGSFDTSFLVPGRYRLRLSSFSSSRPWRAVSAIVGGMDLLDTPALLENADLDGVVVTVTSRPAGTIEGTIRTPQGGADANAVVVLLPADPQRLGGPRTRILFTTAAGGFRASNLPAGEYVLALTTDERMEQGLDREELLRMIGGGARVTLTDGERRTVDLRSGGL